jgi:FixJ family two-component response regulator
MGNGASMEVPVLRMIYVVDDDAAVRDSLGVLLESYGFRVSEHASGDEFLKNFSNGQAACVVLDINMPGISGADVLDTLRARGEHVPVVAITGRGDPILKERLLKSGASAVLDKPVETDALVDAIGDAFASRS